MRLVNATSNYAISGRLEVYHAGQWVSEQLISKLGNVVVMDRRDFLPEGTGPWA